MGACISADPLSGLWTSEESQQGGEGGAGRGVQQVKQQQQQQRVSAEQPWPPCFHLFPAEPSVSREASPPPKLRASALIWSPKWEFITGSPTGVKRKPSGRSWQWTPLQLRHTASTHCCRTAHHTIPKPALPLQVRHRLLFFFITSPG